MARMRVLVVDDEEGMLEVCRDALGTLAETEVVTEQDGRRAADRLRSERFDVLISDIRMPGMDGVELLRIGRETDPDLRALMITAFPTVETAVESMKLGAADYIPKPFRPEEFAATVRRMLEEKRLREENHLLRRQIEKSYSADDIIGQSPAMQAVLESVFRVAPTDVDVLIVGETGTGKELVARNIHKHSRRNGRFVPVDCGAIPEGLLESEFFGHERGAFTGAATRSLGLMEYAHKGTLFLDEIAELPWSLQGKLLRALQERKIRRVGGREEIALDVRVLAATSRDLETEVRRGRFREELYYRVNVVRIDLPPLRERREDIPLLVRHFVDRHSRKTGKDEVRVSAEVLDVLCGYSWPGNIRELENVVKRALAWSRGDAIQVDDLPDSVLEGSGDREGDGRGFFQVRKERIAAFEREYLSALLKAAEGDVSRAAHEAKVPRGSLYRLLKKHGLDPSAFRTG